MLRSVLTAMLASALILLSSPAAAAERVDTRAAATSTAGPFGVPSIATMGQIITVPAGESSVTEIAFSLVSVPSTTVFRAAIYAWDGSRASGPSLYESQPTSTTGTALQTLTFTPASAVPVTPGGQYVIFLSTSKDQAVGSGSGFMSASVGDSYSGGHIVHLNNGNDPTFWTTVSWSQTFAASDLGFMVQFGTPEPAAVPTVSEWGLILFGTVLVGGAALYLQRRRRLI